MLRCPRLFLFCVPGLESWPTSAGEPLPHGPTRCLPTASSNYLQCRCRHSQHVRCCITVKLTLIQAATTLRHLSCKHSGPTRPKFRNSAKPPGSMIFMLRNCRADPFLLGSRPGDSFASMWPACFWRSPHRLALYMMRKLVVYDVQGTGMSYCLHQGESSLIKSTADTCYC